METVIEEKKSDDKAPQNEASVVSTEELEKRLNKFDQFVAVLTVKNYFKDHKHGSHKYLSSLDVARTQWNQRFPQFKLDSLDLIANRPTSKLHTFKNISKRLQELESEKDRLLQLKQNLRYTSVFVFFECVIIITHTHKYTNTHMNIHAQRWFRTFARRKK